MQGFVLGLEDLFECVVGPFQPFRLLVFLDHVLHRLPVLVGELSYLPVLLDVSTLHFQRLSHPVQLELLEDLFIFFDPFVELVLLLFERFDFGGQSVDFRLLAFN